MATTRSFTNGFEVVDYTDELLLIPNQWGLINELGIFQPESVAQHSITVEAIEGTLGLIRDTVRGSRNNVNREDGRKLYSFAIPHFPLDDFVLPSDVQGKRAYGQADAAETEAAVIARKLARIRQNHAVTMEAARAQAITQGTIYAPNGTVAGNYYTSFGITRKEVDFVLGTTTTDVNAKIEEVIAHIQDNIRDGSVVNSVAFLCSPEFFNKLISHPNVKEAYKYYSSTQEPLRERLGTGLYRRFMFAGAEFIEYRGNYNGTRLIPAGDAYAMPVGASDMFVSYFGPGNKFDLVNTLGEEAYVWTFRDPKGGKIEIESESNHLHLVRRPAAVVRANSSN